MNGVKIYIYAYITKIKEKSKIKTRTFVEIYLQYNCAKFQLNFSKNEGAVLKSEIFQKSIFLKLLKYQKFKKFT